jgi:hypothetical protein
MHCVLLLLTNSVICFVFERGQIFINIVVVLSLAATLWIFSAATSRAQTLIQKFFVILLETFPLVSVTRIMLQRAASAPNCRSICDVYINVFRKKVWARDSSSYSLFFVNDSLVVVQYFNSVEGRGSVVYLPVVRYTVHDTTMRSSFRCGAQTISSSSSEFLHTLDMDDNKMRAHAQASSHDTHDTSRSHAPTTQCQDTDTVHFPLYPQFEILNRHLCSNTTVVWL